MIDFCQDWPALAAQIDAAGCPECREWDKAEILLKQPDWRAFVAKLTGAKQRDITKCLDFFMADGEFQYEIAHRFAELDAMTAAGDLRFHSLTLYTIVRLTKPKVVIETGVANGKSSAMILLALHHNKQGILYSLDLPNAQGRTLPDGALTNTGDHETGWLVPDYLRPRWRLKLGDSLQLLSKLAMLGIHPDLFLHDSLHTPEHVTAELEMIAPGLKKGGLVLVDNADMVEDALWEWTTKHKQEEFTAYRNFAGVMWR